MEPANLDCVILPGCDMRRARRRCQSEGTRDDDATRREDRTAAHGADGTRIDIQRCPGATRVRKVSATPRQLYGAAVAKALDRYLRE
jgi:hypothetical protein